MRAASSLLLVPLATLSFGCSDSSGPDVPDPTVEHGPLVTISPATLVMHSGESIQFTAAIKRGASLLSDATTASWFSSDAGVASVTDGGVVRGLRPGVTQIVAVLGSARGTAQVTVTDDRIDGSGHHGCLKPLLAGDRPTASRPAC
ncbi:MAG TPA: Ig-like domain-containing protein [Gemmatimonadales bacterium]|nr:Ig-like domain-containing protein [Gemmatimonadales bacterium]